MTCEHQLIPPALSKLVAWGVLIVAASAHVLAYADGTEASQKAHHDDAEINASTLPSFSARHIRVHEPSERELLRADIELSPQGLRVRQAVQGERHREMLQDFTNNDAWLMDHKRSIAHRLPLAEESDDTGTLPGDGSSFLSQRACGQLLTAEVGDKGVWRGRSVQAWHCKDDTGEIIAIELVDQIYGIVVYRRTNDGQVDELSNLKDRQFSAGHFTLDKGFRTVTKQEFFGGAPNIPRYQEPE